MNPIDIIRKEFKEQPISVAGSIASIVALINTFITLPVLFSSDTPVPKMENNFVLMVCCFFLLEGALASAFGRIYVFLRELGSGFPMILIYVNAIISAWVTGYNSIWMFYSYVKESPNLYYYLLAPLLIGWLISIYFISHHCTVRQKLAMKNKSPEKLSWEVKDEYKMHKKYIFIVNFSAFIFISFYWYFLLGNKIVA